MGIVAAIDRRKSGQNVAAKAFRTRCKPATKLAQADDPIAPVVHRAGHEPTWNPKRPGGVNKPMQRIVDNLGRYRRPFLLPLRKQLIQGSRIDHGAGKDVAADRRGLLDHGYRKFAAALSRSLRQSAGGRQSGRPGTDDNDVELHGFVGQGTATAVGGKVAL
jgi:hypothetical protein